jgi:hypothetical protein
MGQFEESDTLIKVALVRCLMQGDFLHQFLLLDAPLFGHLDVERVVDAAIELVDVHGMNAVLEPITFSLQAGDRVVVFLALVRVALAQAGADPLQHLVSETQSTKDLREFLGDDFFTHVGLIAFPLVAGAVIIGIPALLELAHESTAAMAAIDEAREGEVALAAPKLAGIAGIKDALHALPEFSGDKGLVLAPVMVAFPFKVAGVDAVAQDCVHCAGRYRRSGAAVDEAG